MRGGLLKSCQCFPDLCGLHSGKTDAACWPEVYVLTMRMCPALAESDIIRFFEYDFENICTLPVYFHSGSFTRREAEIPVSTKKTESWREKFNPLLHLAKVF